MDEQILKPCPFCGGTKIEIEKSDRNEVTCICKSCAFHWHQKTLRNNTDWLKGVMSNQWNSRPIEDAQAATIAEQAETIRKQAARIERMKEALEFYSADASYLFDWVEAIQEDVMRGPIYEDAGEKAREALKDGE